MITDLYEQLPFISKPYLIIIIVLLICVNVGIWKIYNEFKKRK